MLTRTTGFKQAGTGFIQAFAEREISERGSTRTSAAIRAGAGRRALVDTKVVRDDLDPVLVSRIQRLASDAVNLDESVKSHIFIP